MPDFELENNYDGIVCGIDEAGRGPWAGPVVAGAVVIKDKNIHPELLKYLNDSKKLSAQRREKLYNLLFEEEKIGKVSIGIGLASRQEIDKNNILNATFLAMERARANLNIIPEIALVDGNQKPRNFNCTTQTVVKGDTKSYSIAAASVVAKVYRDKLMKDLAVKYPHYAFEKNAGYGTNAHIEGLKKYGITPEHRLSYKPIQEFLSKK